MRVFNKTEKLIRTSNIRIIRPVNMYSIIVFQDDGSTGDATLSAADVVLYGLNTLVPLMSVDLLKVKITL